MKCSFAGHVLTYGHGTLGLWVVVACVAAELVGTTLLVRWWHRRKNGGWYQRRKAVREHS